MHLLFQYLVFHHTTDPLYEKLLKLIKYLFVLQPNLLLLRYFPHQLIKFWTHGNLLHFVSSKRARASMNLNRVRSTFLMLYSNK